VEVAKADLKLAEKISFKMIFKNKTVLMNYLAGTFSLIFLVCFDSILALRVKSFGYDNSQVGFIFALPCIVYAVTASFVGKACKVYEVRTITFVAFVGNTLSLLILGPSKMLEMPNDFSLSLLGLALLGISHAFIVIPLVPEIMRNIIKTENLPDPPPQILNDKVSAMYSSFNAVGCITAPVLGGALADLYDFRTVCDVMACGSLIFTVFFFFMVFMCGSNGASLNLGSGSPSGKLLKAKSLEGTVP
jgi:MFS family permease